MSADSGPPLVDMRLPGSAAREASRIAADLARGLEDGGTALILDLEPVLALHIAARLNELRLAHAVLVLPRWPYVQAILPVAALLEELVRQAQRLTDGDLPNVAFVLDAERSRPVSHRSRTDERADNRYRLTVGDLPNLAALRARGIRKVVKVSGRQRGSYPSPLNRADKAVMEAKATPSPRAVRGFIKG